MPALILATGTTAASSSDVVVAAGSTLTVALKSPAAGAVVSIDLKDDAGAYSVVDVLRDGKPAVVIAGAGTYRFTRTAGSSCGVFSG